MYCSSNGLRVAEEEEFTRGAGGCKCGVEYGRDAAARGCARYHTPSLSQALAISFPFLFQLPFSLSSTPESYSIPTHASTGTHAPAGERSENVAKLMMRFGADPNRRDHAGQTPLHRAAVYCNTRLARCVSRAYFRCRNRKMQSSFTL